MYVQCQLQPCYINVVDFITRNKVQIAQKSRTYFWLCAGDYENEIAKFILEKSSEYDPAKGSPEKFVFGNIEKRLRRGKINPLSYPLSLDSNCEESLALRNAMEEHQLPFAEVIYDRHEAEEQSMTPSKHAVLEIANAISGLDIDDIAALLALSARRVRQLINKMMEDCRHERYEELLKNKLFLLVGGRGMKKKHR